MHIFNMERTCFRLASIFNCDVTVSDVLCRLHDTESCKLRTIHYRYKCLSVYSFKSNDTKRFKIVILIINQQENVSIKILQCVFKTNKNNIQVVAVKN